MHNLDSLRAGDVGYVGTNAGAFVSLVGLVIFDGWEVAAPAATSLTAKVARGQAGIGAAGDRRYNADARDDGLPGACNHPRIEPLRPRHSHGRVRAAEQA